MNAQAKALLDEARKYIGYTEKPDNITMFGEWLGRQGEPWCASFVSYVAFKSGTPIPPTSSTNDMLAGFKERKRISRYPLPGSVVFFAWDKSQDPVNVQHAGLVEAADLVDMNLQTIEGNTGDGVYRRLRNMIYVCGYGHWYTPRTVGIGDSGEPVPLVQHIVKVTMDGKFGPVTQKAVKTFQSKRGIGVDGIVGPVTWDRMLYG